MDAMIPCRRDICDGSGFRDVTLPRWNRGDPQDLTQRATLCPCATAPMGLASEGGYWSLLETLEAWLWTGPQNEHRRLIRETWGREEPEAVQAARAVVYNDQLRLAERLGLTVSPSLYLAGASSRWEDACRGGMLLRGVG